MAVLVTRPALLHYPTSALHGLFCLLRICTCEDGLMWEALSRPCQPAGACGWRHVFGTRGITHKSKLPSYITKTI